jgi:hypothetical protein
MIQSVLLPLFAALLLGAWLVRHGGWIWGLAALLLALLLSPLRLKAGFAATDWAWACAMSGGLALLADESHWRWRAGLAGLAAWMALGAYLGLRQSGMAGAWAGPLLAVLGAGAAHGGKRLRPESIEDGAVTLLVAGTLAWFLPNASDAWARMPLLQAAAPLGWEELGPPLLAAGLALILGFLWRWKR